VIFASKRQEGKIRHDSGRNSRFLAVQIVMNTGERASLSALQEEMFQLVREEHAAQRAALQRLWSRPLEERIEEGRTIANLKVISCRPPKTLVMGCQENDSRFREGDFVRLSRGNPEFPDAEAIFVAGHDDQIELSLWGSGSLSKFPPKSGGWQIDESKVDLEKRYLEALEDLGKTAIGRECILPLLNDSRRPVLDAELFEEGFDRASREDFDDLQAEAMANAVATDLCWLIHGPPGTGKTRVLAWIVAELAARGERVFVTGFTHRSINNLLEAIAGRLADGRLLAKIAPFRDPGLLLPQFENFRDTPFVGSGTGYVIGGTPFSLRSRRLGGVDFDTVVMDEASQITLPLAVMAMLAGRRYILAGDHHQLPPVTLSRTPREALQLSIFGRLAGRGFDTLLTTSRRLNAPLCAWPSETFYLSRLISHPSAAGRRLRATVPPRAWPEVFHPDSCLVWLAIPHVGSRTVAMEEATLACELLDLLQAGGVAWSDVGVVVPYRRQARMLRRHLGHKLQKTLGPKELVIDTVERMQGQEREVIIVSFTTSDGGFALKMAEFLLQPQRLNVSVTRARTKVILLASPELLRLAEAELDEEMGGAFVSLLQSARRIDVPLPS
jgi:DNA replication ATP-dependent helicase Dna2